MMMHDNMMTMIDGLSLLLLKGLYVRYLYMLLLFFIDDFIHLSHALMMSIIIMVGCWGLMNDVFMNILIEQCPLIMIICIMWVEC
jgi:hypothetical protein